MSNRIQQILHEPIAVINIGVEHFFLDFQERHVPSVCLDWQPPKQLDGRLREILDRIHS